MHLFEASSFAEYTLLFCLAVAAFTIGKILAHYVIKALDKRHK